MKRLLLPLLLLLAAPLLAQTTQPPCGTGTTQLASGLTATTYADTTAADGATYSYVVTANNLGGATCSNILGNVVVPATGAHTVILTWTASTTSGVTYAVFRAPQPAPPTNLTATGN